MKLLANAKINLTLGITGKREDGYHTIDSVMQSVSLHDTVEINLANELQVHCGLPELDGSNNIAYTTARAFFEYTAMCGGADIKIKKNIPAAAGLGGGSADAAAVLVGLNALYKTELSMDTLCEIALKVGADVPFCLYGGTARVGGIGEQIEPLPDINRLYFVIAKNGLKASTKEMYAKFDTLENPFLPNTSAAVDAVLKGEHTALINNIGNSFSSLTGLYEIDTTLQSTAPLAVSLSGSGPSVFAVYDNEACAQSGLNLLKSKGIEAYFATPEKSGIIV